jgi:hypothetical protein
MWSREQGDRGVSMTRRLNEANDRVLGSNAALTDASLLEFWRWAFSDLCDDDVKGIFAEWLVIKLLNIPHLRRISWANSDMMTVEDVRIEVKSSAFWQSWKLVDELGAALVEPAKPACEESKVRFSGLRARDAVTLARRSDTRAFKADVYVFAFQNERNPSRWNAMDLSQWEFYVCTRMVLASIAGDSVSLSNLRSKVGVSSADELATRVRGMIADVKDALSLPQVRPCVEE